MEKKFQDHLIRPVDLRNSTPNSERRLDNFLKSGEINTFQQKQETGTLMRGDSDDYLSDLLNVLKIRTLVVGVGGAGNNTISRLQEGGLIGANTLNVNTDAQDLYYSHSNEKILIGKEISKGLGTGNDPEIGRESAESDTGLIRDFMNVDVVFLTCGLGGGTGTGASPVIAREAKRAGALVVTFCTLPFRMEGDNKRIRANYALQELSKYSDTLIPIPNDRILGLVPKISLLTGFKIMDEVLVRSVRGLVGLINNCGLVNLDYADVKNVLRKQGKYPSGVIGIAESIGDKNDLIYKTRLAINNPLLKPNPKEVDKCLVSITGNHNLALSKIDNIVSTVSNEISNSADLKFGAMIDPNLGDKTRILFLGKGPVSPYVLQAENMVEDGSKKTIAEFKI